MLHFIYKWDDPRDKTTRYIGITTHPNARIRQHIRCDGSNPKKDSWIQELDALGIEPLIEVIEIAYNGRKSALEREKYWIEHYFNQGCPLLNILLIPSTQKSSSESSTPDKEFFDTDFACFLVQTMAMKEKEELTLDEIHAALEIYTMVEAANGDSEYSEAI